MIEVNKQKLAVMGEFLKKGIGKLNLDDRKKGGKKLSKSKSKEKNDTQRQSTLLIASPTRADPPSTKIKMDRADEAMYR